MAISIDQAFNVQATAMQARSRRAGVLAANIANADTPGYKARDIDFKSAMRAAEQGVTLRTTSAAHVAPDAAPGGELKYRVPLQPSVDGNTVDGHVEKSEFMKNGTLYSAGLTFLGARINGLITALRGGQ